MVVTIKDLPVGAIRVNVRLTNATDEARMRRGEIADNEVRSVIVDALVDTGAVQSVIPQSLLEQLGLQTRRQRTAVYADGRAETVGLTQGILFQIDDRDTMEEALVLGDEVLIGHTVLEKLDLLADCKNQRLVPAHPNGPVSMVK